MAPQPFIPLADGVQAELLFVLGGKIVENRLWFIARNPPITTFNMQALADGLLAWHTSELLPSLAQELTLISVIVSDWTAFPLPAVVSAPAGVDGGDTSGVHSANVAIRVAFNGDSSQDFPDNSNFVPGIPRGQVDGNYYSLAIRTIIRNAYINVIDDAASWGTFPAWRWVITSRRFQSAWRVEQKAARTDIIRFPSPVISPRRRRLP